MSVLVVCDAAVGKRVVAMQLAGALWWLIVFVVSRLVPVRLRADRGRRVIDSATGQGREGGKGVRHRHRGD